MKNFLELFLRNGVVHSLIDTTLSPTELLKFKDVLLFFLQDLQIFMHSFGELIQDTPRTGELSHTEKIRLKKRFLEIKKSIP